MYSLFSRHFSVWILGNFYMADQTYLSFSSLYTVEKASIPPLAFRSKVCTTLPGWTSTLLEHKNWSKFTAELPCGIRLIATKWRTGLGWTRWTRKLTDISIFSVAEISATPTPEVQASTSIFTLLNHCGLPNVAKLLCGSGYGKYCFIYFFKEFSV